MTDPPENPDPGEVPTAPDPERKRQQNEQDLEGRDLDFITSKLQVNEWADKWGVSRSHAYHWVLKYNLWEKREKFREKAIEKALRKAEELTVGDWGKYRQVLRAGLGMAIKIVQQYQGPDGQFVRSMKPSELAQFFGALKDYQNNLALLDGRPTQITESRNVNLDVVDAIEKIERGEL